MEASINQLSKTAVHARRYGKVYESNRDEHIEVNLPSE